MPQSVSTLLAQHEAQLLVVTNREAKAVIRALHDSEREVLGTLAADPNLFHQAALGSLVMRLVELRLALEARLRGVLDPASREVIRLVGVHLQAVADTAGPLALPETARLQALSALTRQEGLLLHQYSVGRFSQRAMGRIQAALVASVAQGESQAKALERVRGAAGPLALNRREADLVARMELSQAYSVAGGEVAATLYEVDNGWRKRIVETIDSRNHPFSRAADGVTARPGERFKVPVADVQAAATTMGRRVGRVLWAESGGYYRGMSLPAHYGERGRVVPWHRGWPA